MYLSICESDNLSSLDFYLSMTFAKQNPAPFLLKTNLSANSSFSPISDNISEILTPAKGSSALKLLEANIWLP